VSWRAALMAEQPDARPACPGCKTPVWSVEVLVGRRSEHEPVEPSTAVLSPCNHVLIGSADGEFLVRYRKFVEASRG